MERRAATIQDVAARAGVSITTVSRVLNDTGYPMRPETRRRVIEAIEALDFRPSPLARGLLGKSTSTIGLIIPDISNPYYPLLSRGVEDVASEHGYTVIFCNTDRNLAKLRSYLEVLREKQADGIIFAGGGIETDGEHLTPDEIGDRVVLIGRHRWPLPSVQIDNTRAAYEATSHLIALGHRRIAYLGGPTALTSARDRMKGYRQAMLELVGAGPWETLIREGDFGFESGYQAILSLLSQAVGQRPTAIFAANDQMALGVLAAARDLGTAVPEELAVVGFDDIPAGRYVRPSLTTVALPTYEMGASAARLLLQLLAGDTTEQTILLPTQLVVRQSSGEPLR
ncbi:MAG: LacI family DNA-binding transcriptional regulator [Sphingomonadaceae bacterium]